MTTPTRPQGVEVRGLTKRFAGHAALDDVDLTIEPGEVLGLLGENGSGKSTMIKVLAGFHTPDSGALTVGGERLALPLSGGFAREAGFEFVHQDLGLVDSLSITENLLVPEMNARRLALRWSREHERARETFARYGIDLDPRLAVSDVRPVRRAQIAIVRAMEGMRRTARTGRSGFGGLLVLDEPTVFLPKEEVDQLFALVREVADSGAGVLFVSHDIDEVMALTDRVTVLRDGTVAGTVVTADTSAAELVRLIVGRDVPELSPATPTDVSHAPSVARVRSLSVGPLRDVDLDLRAGEILGVTGLQGSGFERLPQVLAGAEAGVSGTLSWDDVTLDLHQWTPRRAVTAGFALVPADRANDGSLPELSLADNLLYPTHQAYMRHGRLQHAALRRRADELAEQFDVRPRDTSRTFRTLSGGNQQKAVLAKWLEVSPRVLLLHEPTQGVDIGARQQIFTVLRDSLSPERAVLCASSDHDQLAAVCDRVVVLGRGGITAELSGASLTRENITECCLTSTSLQEAVA